MLDWPETKFETTWLYRENVLSKLEMSNYRFIDSANRLEERSKLKYQNYNTMHSGPDERVKMF